MRSPGFIVTFITVIALLGCAPVPEHRAGFFVFGTLVEVVLRDTTDEQAQAAFTRIQGELQSMHREWHAWEPGELDDINRKFAAGEAATATADLVELVRLSQEMEARSGGRFNAAAGGLVRLWGFHTSEFPVIGPRPADQAIAVWLASAPSALDIEIDGNRLTSSNPAVQLDFGGIAKGYAVDRVIEMLAGLGIHQAMVNAGGDLRAVGASETTPWRVGVRDPGGGVVAGIEIHDAAAVFTSGVDQRYHEQDGLRWPHILDPGSGQPVQGLASVTVIGDRGWLADAAATALMVAGPQDWAAVAGRLGLDSVLVIDAGGRYFASPAMAQRLQWAGGMDDARLTIVALAEPERP